MSSPDTPTLALEILLRNQAYSSAEIGASLPQPFSDPPHDTDCPLVRSSFLTSTPQPVKV